MNDPDSHQIRRQDDEEMGGEGGGGGSAGDIFRYPPEAKKTFVAGGFTIFNFLLTAVSLAYVHEMHPEGTDPLPDQFLDRIPYQVFCA